MDILANIHLLRPMWLLAGLPTVCLVWLLWRRSRSGQGWRQVIHPDLLPHLLDDSGSSGSRFPVQALLLIWLLAILALAGPSWEKIPQPVQRKQDAMVIVLDLSYSMFAEDLSPTRLKRASHKLLDLLQQRKEGTTALIAYAGDAHVVSPLTDDNRTIANLLPALAPQIMPIKGSRPAAAIEQALALFRAAGAQRGQILLLSDGVQQRDVEQINELLAPTRFSLSVLGIGTSEGGPIPVPQQGLLKDADNNIVIASLDRAPLQQLAADNGGAYADISLDESDLEQVIQPPFDPSQEQDLLLDRSADQWHDAGFWLVLALLPLALGSFRRGWLLCLPLLLMLPPQPASAFEWQDVWQTRDQRAAKLLEQGESDAAAQAFENPDWKAAASYRAEDYKAALEHYSKAETADQWYNQGNALARSGDLDRALAAYEEALARDPDLEDAKFNRDLVERLQQQQDQQQNQDQDQDQNQEQDQEQDQQNQNQQNQDQQQSQQDQQNQQRDQQDQEQQQDQNQQQNQQNQENEKDQQEQNQQKRDREEQEKQEQEQEQDKQENNKPSQDPEQSPEDKQQQMAEAQKSEEEQEREQATEQWLRLVPDDPAGLLRRKFLYESQQNNRQQRENDEPYW